MAERETDLGGTPGRPVNDPSKDRHELGDTRTGEGDRSSEQIRGDIDRTRARLDETVDALEDKLAPSELMDRVWEKVNPKERSREALAFVREHPLPIAVAGIGVGWLIFETIRGGSEKSSSKRDESHDPGSLLSDDEMGTELSGGYDARVGSRLDTGFAYESEIDREYGSHESGIKGRISEAAGKVRRKTTGGLRRANERVEEMSDERPLAIGGLTFGLGLALGLSLPSTSAERRTMGNAGRRAVEETRSAGKEVVHKSRRVAETAVEAAKEEFDRQGLAPSRLGEKIKDVANEARNAARDKAAEEGLIEGPGRKEDTGDSHDA